MSTLASPRNAGYSIEVPRIDPGSSFVFDSDIYTIRINTEWTTKLAGIVCDLDLILYLYDERARFIERVDTTRRKSSDGNCTLHSEIDMGNVNQSNSFLESVKIDINELDSKTEAILLYLDGGPRNYQFVQNIGIQCYQIPSEKSSYSISESLASKQTKALFQCGSRARKDFHGVALGVLYKDGWFNSSRPKWAIKTLFDPFNFGNAKEVDEKCHDIIINHVPNLTKFRPRIFNSVRDICSALSSVSLPKLKMKFLKNAAGLPIMPFTEVLFKQLFEGFPRISEEGEAAYLVAMIQEMFNQIGKFVCCHDI